VAGNGTIDVAKMHYMANTNVKYKYTNKTQSIRMVNNNNSFFCLCFHEEDYVTLILNVKTCVFNKESNQLDATMQLGCGWTTGLSISKPMADSI
jgi:hypothetical protein